MSSPPSMPFTLPPLPKSLSGAFDKDNLALLQEEMLKQQQLQQQPTRQRPTPPPRNPPPAPPRNPPPPRPSTKRHAPPVPPPPVSLQHQSSSSRLPISSVRTSSSLDAQLAVLRQEMVGLRQLDLSLLSQLWALNENIQEFRAMLQEQDEATLSPPSADENDEMFRLAPTAGLRLPGAAVLPAVPEQYILSSSSSESSVEFGNV
ncbi:leucine repeat adapter protein 25 isoform X1 [Neocloeon triangulifer]|uniref:leucine repeat adapter protein 25 isoform X1 n=1 Tax=Neocloeon triangulifer TaxID=2078957 RepID=UPI00286EEF82|nr:leucine repeat adapter protein 25 isoform X1 [Neocloeon triangulifer]